MLTDHTCHMACNMHFELYELHCYIFTSLPSSNSCVRSGDQIFLKSLDL